MEQTQLDFEENEKIPKTKSKKNVEQSQSESEEKVPKTNEITMKQSQINETYDFSEFGVEYISVENLKQMIENSEDERVKDYFKVINDKIIPEMNKNDIKTFIVPSPLNKRGKPIKDIEYTGQYLKQVYDYENEYSKINDFIFVFHIDNKNKTVETEFGIKIDFELNAGKLKIAKNILKNSLTSGSFPDWNDSKYRFIKNINYYQSQEF